MFSQLLRGTKGKRYEDMVFKEEGYVVDQNGAYKHKIFDEEYEGKDKDGKKVIRKRRVLIYWDKSDADMAYRKREEKLRKAGRACKNNVYGIKKGIDE